MMDFFYNVMFEGHSGKEGHDSDSFHWPTKAAAQANGFSYTASDNGWSPNGRNAKCDGYSDANSVHIKGYYMGLAYDAVNAVAMEQRKQAWVVQHGVLSIGICAGPAAFNAYTSGIVNGSACTSNRGCWLDHAVATVGFGTQGSGDGRVDFWRIKNSWGTDWGENGYIRIVREQNCLGLGEETIAVLVGNNEEVTTPAPTTPEPTTPEPTTPEPTTPEPTTPEPTPPEPTTPEPTTPEPTTP